MGKIVSVWSSTKKTGKTLFLYSLTRQLSGILLQDIKILVACVNLSYGNLMSMFCINKNELNFEDIVNLKIHPDSELNMLEALAKRDNIYFLGSAKTSKSYANRNLKIFENLLEEFRDTFDLILIDTISGFENPLTNMIIDKSDCVFNIITQDKESLDKARFISDRDVAYVINGYRDIYPDVREMTTLYGLKNTFTLPICNELQEMKNRGRLEHYIQHETEYNTGVKDVAKFLAQTLKLEYENDYVAEEKRKRAFLTAS